MTDRTSKSRASKEGKGNSQPVQPPLTLSHQNNDEFDPLMLLWDKIVHFDTDCSIIKNTDKDLKVAVTTCALNSLASHKEPQSHDKSSCAREASRPMFTGGLKIKKQDVDTQTSNIKPFSARKPPFPHDPK